MKVKILVLGLIVFFIFGCAMLRMHQLNYSISLIEVERPKEAKERYGEQKITYVDEKDYSYAFEDEMIKILWLPSSIKMSFLMENKTDHSIRIIWDEGSYVDENGGSHRIMHSGIKYTDKAKSQPPSVIIRKGNLAEVILPSDYVTFKSSSWQETPSLPTTQLGGNPQKLLGNAKKHINKTIQILLPIQIEEFTNDYIFIFKINDVEYTGFKQY